MQIPKKERIPAPVIRALALKRNQHILLVLCVLRQCAHDGQALLHIGQNKLEIEVPVPRRFRWRHARIPPGRGRALFLA